MVDLVEASCDVALEDPLVFAMGKLTDLLDRILSSPVGAEPVADRVEIHLQDWLQHQL